MEYFQIKQDKRYINPPLISNLSRIVRRKEFCLKNEHKIPRRNVVFANHAAPLDFLDLLDDQLLLVTEKVKRVIALYEPTVMFKTFCILNNCQNEYCVYYAPLLPEIDCVTQVTGLGRGRNIILNREQIGMHCLFKAVGTENETIVVRLDAAESLLRREVKGVIWKRLDVR